MKTTMMISWIVIAIILLTMFIIDFFTAKLGVDKILNYVGGFTFSVLTVVAIGDD